MESDDTPPVKRQREDGENGDDGINPLKPAENLTAPDEEQPSEVK